MRKHPVVSMAVAGVVSAALAFGGISAVQASPSAGPPAQPVTVTNTPLPVQGNVSVVNTPTVNVGNQSLPVTGTVSIAIPATGFSTPPFPTGFGGFGTDTVKVGSPTERPDPSGTRYAITSVTIINPNNAIDRAQLQAAAYNSFSTTCASPLGTAIAIANGPEVVVPPSSTVQLTFPQPFITAAVAGPGVCLVAAANPGFQGLLWSAVGYRLLP